MSDSSALAGVKVLDLTHALAGPFCTMMLADLGADVVKIEHPDGGDRTRREGLIGDFSTYFGSINRGKRGIVLDLKSPAGVDVAKRLADQADVVVFNFAPGVVERMGLSFAELEARNPRLIYAICSGFGQTGPWAERPGVDPMIQALSGIMSVTGEPAGPPVRVGYSIGDLAGGMFLTVGILSALYERERSGRGQLVDIGLLDCQLALMENHLVTYMATGKLPKRTGSRHPRALLTRIYPTCDGDIMVGFSKRNWQTACRVVLGQPQWADFATTDTPGWEVEVEPLLVEIMRGQPTQYWIEKLETSGILFASVNTAAEVVAQAQIKARDMIQETVNSAGRRLKVIGSPIKMSRTPAKIQSAAPLLGEHTREVLSDWLGVEGQEQRELHDKGAFRASSGKRQWIW
jgi:CoA:oxalate CoA-transferase